MQKLSAGKFHRVLRASPLVVFESRGSRKNRASNTHGKFAASRSEERRRDNDCCCLRRPLRIAEGATDHDFSVSSRCGGASRWARPGRNATPIGAAANLTAVGIAERSGVRVSFLQYLAYGLPMTIASIGICDIYVWLRYF
jgi:hypothetical protein